MALRELVKSRFKIGAAANWAQLKKDPLLREIVAEEFNLIAPTNEFKMNAVRPNTTLYNIVDAEAIVDFALSREMAVRAGCLVWYLSVPFWLLGRSKKEIESALKDYIFTIMRQYRGRVMAWDVVNEAFTDKGLFRNSFWFKALGAEYIFKAYQWAREADPDAQLFYCDYNLHLLAKQKVVFQMVKELRESGLSIDGIAIQTHHNLTGVPKTLWLVQFVESLKQAKLIPHFSEVTLWINPGIPKSVALEIQAAAYRSLLALCLKLGCPVFNIWGVTDKYVWWHPEKEPFLFDAEYQPKKAYYQVAEVLKSFEF